MLLCPSDATSGNGTLTGRANLNGGIAYGLSCYKAVCGNNWAWGNFIYQSPTGRYPNQQNGLDLGNGWMCRSGGNFTTVTRMRDLTDGTSNTMMVGEAVAGRCIHTDWFHFNHTTATAAIPLNYYQINKGITPDDWPNNYSFASMHVGGGHFLMGDGTVRFISDNISLATYRALSSIDGGEVLGEF
jgi:hypothetical protein